MVAQKERMHFKQVEIGYEITTHFIYINTICKLSNFKIQYDKLIFKITWERWRPPLYIHIKSIFVKFCLPLANVSCETATITY